MLDIMNRQQFENEYQQSLAKVQEVEKSKQVREEENQQLSLERQMKRVLNEWLLDPHNYKKSELRCPIILQKRMEGELLKELKQMGWEVRRNGYDKYEGGYSYTIM